MRAWNHNSLKNTGAIGLAAALGWVLLTILGRLGDLLIRYKWLHGGNTPPSVLRLGVQVLLILILPFVLAGVTTGLLFPKRAVAAMLMITALSIVIGLLSLAPYWRHGAVTSGSLVFSAVSNLFQGLLATTCAWAVSLERLKRIQVQASST